MSNRLVFLDLETGGLSPDEHAIIQIAMIAATDDQDLEELDRFEVKVLFPPSAADPKVLKENSYDEETWKSEAMMPDEAARESWAFLKEHATRKCVSKKGKPYTVANLAAYNGRFDTEFLFSWAKRRAQSFVLAWPLAFDVMQLAMWRARSNERSEFFPKGLSSYKLVDVCSALGIDLPDAHDAMADVGATVEVARRLSL